MDSITKNTWFKMSVTMQISNIGSEVARAIRYKNEGNEKSKINFCNKAIELLTLSMSDPKNAKVAHEFEYCIEELKDYFLGSNEYNTTDEMLQNYSDAFLY